MGLTDRYTGRRLEGDFVHADDADIDWDNNECPICGAGGFDACNVPDESGRFGVEIDPWVHAERQGGDDE